MPKDYLLDTDLDLKIADGDFVIGESTSQHQQLLLISEKGEWRQYPRTGVGIGSFLEDDEPGAAYSEIQQQFEGDGMKVSNIQIFENGKIEVKAEYRE